MPLKVNRMSSSFEDGPRVWHPKTGQCYRSGPQHPPGVIELLLTSHRGLKYTCMLSTSFRTPIIVAYGVWLDVLCNMRHGKPGAPKTLLEAWKALVAGSIGQAQHEGVARCGWLL